MDAGDIADEAGGGRLAQPAEMRRKAPVLVDGEQEAAALGEFDELSPDREVFHERLLRQDVLAGDESAPHQVDADVGMGRDVENLDRAVAENRLEIVGDPRRGEIGFPASTRMLETARRDRGHVEPVTRIGVEMRGADSPGADQGNADVFVLRHRRAIGEVRRGDIRLRFGGQRVIARRRRAGLVRGQCATLARSPVMTRSTSATDVCFGSTSSATILPRRITTMRSTTWNT